MMLVRCCHVEWSSVPHNIAKVFWMQHLWSWWKSTRLRLNRLLSQILSLSIQRLSHQLVWWIQTLWFHTFWQQILVLNHEKMEIYPMERVGSKSQWPISLQIECYHHLEHDPVMLFVEGIFDFGIINSDISSCCTPNLWRNRSSISPWKHIKNDSFLQNISLQQDDITPRMMPKSKIPPTTNIMGLYRNSLYQSIVERIGHFGKIATCSMT